MYVFSGYKQIKSHWIFTGWFKCHIKVLLPVSGKTEMCLFFIPSVLFSIVCLCSATVFWFTIPVGRNWSDHIVGWLVWSPLEHIDSVWSLALYQSVRLVPAGCLCISRQKQEGILHSGSLSVWTPRLRTSDTLAFFLSLLCLNAYLIKIKFSSRLWENKKIFFKMLLTAANPCFFFFFFNQKWK